MTQRLTLRPPRVRLALAVLGVLALTACGSQLDPDTVSRAESRDGSAVVTDENGQPVAVDTDADGTPDAVTDPGAAVDPSDPGAPQSDDDPGAPAPGEEDVPEENSPTGDTEKGSCEGFENSTGITDSEITLANISDISGPVPGIFQAAQDGVKAFTAYFNATADICGRKLKLLPLDTRSEASGDQQAYTQACTDAFAVIGSMSSQDQGGAATAAGCGVPDIRAISTTPQRISCGSCFSTYSVSVDKIAASQPAYWKKAEPSASQHVAIFYVDVEAARVNAEAFAQGFERGGMNVDLVQGIGTTEFNYTPFVQQMKDEDIDFVMYFGPFQFTIKLQQAMAQQSFDPAVFLQDPTIYDTDYVEQANGVGDGSYVYSTVELFDNTKIPEMALYRSYLEQVAPGSTPNYYGLYAWSAARLFAEEATRLGGKLSRATLVAALKQVKNWTSNGIHAPMAVGAKTTSPCLKIFQLGGSTWKQVSSGDFLCGGLISTN